MTENTPLVVKMRALADTAMVTPAQAAELRLKADALELAIHATGAANYAKNMLGHYARARILYCNITGEPLV